MKKPNQPVQLPTKRAIKIIGIVFSGYFLFLLYLKFSMITFLLTDITILWDNSATLYFSQLLILAIGIILFLMQKKAGWIYFTIYLTYAIISSIWLFIEAINWEPSNIPLIDSLFTWELPSITCLVLFGFFTGILWIICKENVRQVYNIDKTRMILTVGISSVLTIGILTILNQ